MNAAALHLVVPDGIEDPARPSGGNTYDRRLRAALQAAGWVVHSTEVRRACSGADDLAAALGSLPDGSLALVDGLVASHRPDVVVPACRRLRLVVLLHMPAGAHDPADLEKEGAVLRSAAAVIAPSCWCRDWLLASYGLEPARVHVAHPGVDAADPASGSSDGASNDGGSLLCVGAVTRRKGHDLLLAALAEVADLGWRCLCLGSRAVEPAFVCQLVGTSRDLGLEGRFVLGGPRSGAGLAVAYAGADVLVHPTRAETYGMVVSEALAHGLPVIASAVGGVPEALGATPAGVRPGVLVAPNDAAAFAAALRAWLSDRSCRQLLRAAALERRTHLTGWDRTAERVARVLEAA